MQVLESPQLRTTDLPAEDVQRTEALIKEARHHQHKRWLVIVATLALLAVGIVLATQFGSAGKKSATATTSTNNRLAPACLPSQLSVGPLDGAAAAGTGLTAVPLDDLSGVPCSLRGYPSVTFLSRTGAPLRTSVGHSGPGPAFRPSSAVELRPGAGAAGFIITSHDFPTDNETTCPVATALRVHLPGATGSFTVSLTAHSPGMLNLCSPGSPVNIGPIVPVSAFYTYGFLHYVHAPGVDYGARSAYGPSQLRG